MYRTGGRTIVSGSVITGVGVTALPNTAGHTLGTILAYTAITIGVAAIISQIAIRVVRRHYTNA